MKLFTAVIDSMLLKARVFVQSVTSTIVSYLRAGLGAYP